MCLYPSFSHGTYQIFFFSAFIDHKLFDIQMTYSCLCVFLCGLLYHLVRTMAMGIYFPMILSEFYGLCLLLRPH